jgi:succinate dehydrogenase / fumarate reductase flavoprotein subunit
MQGLVDGYFILPNTISDYLASVKPGSAKDHGPEFRQGLEETRTRVKKLLSIRGRRSVDAFHRQLGQLMWDMCGMTRSGESLKKALTEIPRIREAFWNDVNVPGSDEDFNQALERAGRVADYLEFAELLCQDALHREESCGGHFRVEHQTPDGEAKRDDANFCYVAAWEHRGPGQPPALHKEPLVFEHVQLAQRSYK